MDDARLAAVPRHWRVMRLKHVVRLQYGDPLPARARRPGAIPVFGSNGVVGQHDEANTEAPVVLMGRKGSMGKVHFSAGPAFAIDTAYYADRRHLGLGGEVDLRWLAWLLEGLRLDEDSPDTVVPGLARLRAHDTRVPVPPLAEQRAIAAELERTCAAIDALTRARRARVEHLAMLRAAAIRAMVCGADVPGPRRETAIGWIGAVPARWRVDRLKRHARLATGQTPRRTDARAWVDCDIPFVSLADTRALDRAETIDQTAVQLNALGLETSSARVLPAGTVVLTRDATIGLTAVITRPMAVSQHLVGWVPGPHLRSLWLMYALEAMRPELRRLSMGATIATLGLPDLKRLQLPLPPLAEQDALIARLRPRLARIDALVDTTERIVDGLAELRTARVFATTHGRVRPGAGM